MLCPCSRARPVVIVKKMTTLASVIHSRRVILTETVTLEVKTYVDPRVAKRALKWHIDTTVIVVISSGNNLSFSKSLSVYLARCAHLFWFGCWVHFKVRPVTVYYIKYVHGSLCLVCCSWHIETETKWTPFRRRHFQVHFLEWRCLNSKQNFTDVCS